MSITVELITKLTLAKHKGRPSSLVQRCRTKGPIGHWRGLFLSLTQKIVPFLLLMPATLLSAGDFATRPEVAQLMSELRSQNKFKEQELISIFESAQRKQSILDAMQRPAEKTKTWGEYRDIFISNDSINKGLKFWKRHEAIIEKASVTFGVPEEIIVAIIGVETRYGKNRGGYRVIDALSTLAFDYPPRSSFFYKELKEFLLLSKESNLDPLMIRGSYAGAMGYPQFIPSSYRNFAVDFDNNGHIDLINSPEDAIGSVANYFDVHGWITGEEVLLPAKPKKQLKTKLKLEGIANSSLSPNFTLAEIEAHGIKAVQATTHIPASEMGSLMELEGKNGIEHWIGLHNFYVITRYNHSRLYAMAVYQLGQELRVKR